MQSVMDLASGYGAKSEFKPISLNPNAILIIRLPDWRVLRVISQSLFLFTVIVAFLCIRSVMLMNGPSIESISSYESVIGSGLMGSELLPWVFRDLAYEGLVKKGDEALIVSSGIGDLNNHSPFLNAIGTDFVFESDLDHQNSIADETFDLIITSTLQGNKFIDRVLKIGGIVVMQLSNYPSNDFRQQSNYKTVYIRRFSSTVVAMRKMGPADDSVSSPIRRWLSEATPESKKVALHGLEDVLLEPEPWGRALAKSSYEKIKFSPDLLGDSLEGYRRRIFITDENNGVVDWFDENYPMKNQYFEVYNLEIDVYNTEMVDEVMVTRVEPSYSGISDWMSKHVGEEDYVVMKAKSHVVEEMMREKTICLVDELFLECKNQWQYGGEGNKSKRAYWECLALYGRLRDEGVAVHQWWG